MSKGIKTNICEDCGICCFNTEMILSKKDIERIIENSTEVLNNENIVQINNDGYYQLKNVNGYCIFFDQNSKVCNIYDSRPQGCRFYPMIFNMDENCCEFDSECPRTDKFRMNSDKESKICRKIKKYLAKELGFEFHQNL